MTEALRLGKRAFTWGVVVSTIAWSVGVAALVTPLTATAALSLSSGALIKGSLPAVYYYASDGKRYVFVNEKTYKTWYADFSGVQVISDADLATLSIGGNVVYRAGTRMIKIQSDPKTYAVEPGGKLRHVTSEAIVSALYGSAWNQRIDDVSDAFFVNYAAGDAITTNAYPTGSLVKTASSPDIWYIDGTTKRKVTADGFTANRFRDEFVITTTLDISGLTVGTDISVGETALTDTAQTGIVVPPVSVGTGLTISAATDSPAAATIVSDNTGEKGGQALIGGLKIHLVAAADGAVTVTGLKIRRGGISNDADIKDVYVYDGDSLLPDIQLAKSGSIASSIINFAVASGIVTVPAGGSKDLMIRFDLADSVSAGKTVSMSLASADVTTSGTTTVTGSVAGSTFTTALVTDLGQLEMGNVNPTAATTIDPQNDFELWRFKFDAVDQDMIVKNLRITNVGSIDDDDIQNFKLMDGVTQLGSTIATMTGGNLDFDFTGMANGGYKITSGQSKQLSLRGDILGGTNRTYRFTIRESTNALAWDNNYSVYTRPFKDATDAFSVIEPNDAATPAVAVSTTISVGKLTIQIASDSPATNVPDAATNVLLAKWNFTAAGENVKVNSLTANCLMNTTTDDLVNTKLIFNGAQVGTTDATANCDGAEDIAFTFGNSFVVPAGSTKVLEFRADLSDTTIGDGDTIVAQLETGSSNGEGTVSLNTLSTSAVSGRTVTVKTGALAVTVNAALPNYTVTRPTGVLGTTNTKIASFLITGGGEDSDVTQVVIKDDMDVSASDDTFSDIFVNLKLLRGDTGVQIGSTFGSLTNTESTTYTFTPSAAIRVAAGATQVVDLYADIKTTHALSALTAVNSDTDGVATVSSVNATGVTTGTTTSDTDGVSSGQLNYIAAFGVLRVSVDAANPLAQTLVLGHTAKELFRFKLAANVNEAIDVTKILIADSMTGGGAVGATGTLKNFKLINVATGAQVGGTIASLDSATNAHVGMAIFDNIAGLTVPKNGSVVLKVVGDLSTYDGGGVSSSTHRMIIMSDTTPTDTMTSSTYRAQEGVQATGRDSGMQISGGILYFNNSTTDTSIDTDVQGTQIDVFRTKITVALSADSPSGTTSPASEQTVAKFVVTNSMNSGSYAATLELLNLDIGTTISNTAARALKIYKDSVTGGNQLGTTTIYGGVTNVSATQNFADTSFYDAVFTDTEIAGSSVLDSTRTFIITVDTTDAATDKRLTVGLDTGDIRWSDGVTTAISLVESLPVSGRTLSY